jgi:hypothetical protein
MGMLLCVLKYEMKSFLIWAHISSRPVFLYITVFIFYSMLVNTTTDRRIINFIYSDLMFFFTLVKIYIAVSYVTVLTEEYCYVDYRNFGGTFCLHHHGRRVIQARKWQEAGLVSQPASCWFLLGLFIDCEDGGSMFLRNFGGIILDCTPLDPRRWFFSW